MRWSRPTPDAAAGKSASSTPRATRQPLQASSGTWAGGITGENFAAQGNLLAGEDVVKKMGAAFAEPAKSRAASWPIGCSPR